MFKSELRAATGIALGHPLTSSSGYELRLAILWTGIAGGVGGMKTDPVAPAANRFPAF
jgi:hypothetical protein